jgi:hypothetical protein
MGDERLPLPSEHVVCRALDGGMVLVHLRTNRIYSLNPTGARLWTLLSAGVERAALREQLLAEFVVDPEQLDREIETLLQTFADQGLTTEGSAGT